MKKKLIWISLVLTASFFWGRLWMGVYSHDEFGGTHIFFKRKPIWKWSFYSPIGISDLRLEDLTPKKQKEELLFL